MKQIVEEYRKWKEEHPDEDYQYDETWSWLSDLGRGNCVELMEWVNKNYKEK